MIRKLALRAALPTSALVLLSIAQGAAAPQAIPVNRQADTSQTMKILNPGVISWVHFGDLHITDGSSQNYADFKSIIANTNRYQGHASTITISNGSAIWLYTDGLIEASRNIVDGSRRLHETALRLGADMTAGPAATIRNLVIPNGSPDDVAILVVKIDFDESERYITRSHFDSAEPVAASNARRAFAEALSTKRFTDVDIANAEIVFGELCGNVARSAKGPVDVVVDSSGIQTVLHVLDRGVGFQHLSRLPKDPYSERGRGLFIIAAMTTEFTVSQRLGGGSHARAVLVGRRPVSLLLEETLPVVTDQVAQIF